MTTFVLVHGGGHGGWAWQKVARLLEAHGHTVYAPSLTGCGDRAHLVSADVDLNTHITDVANLLFYEDLTDVVLVAHSYGAGVIEGVADRVGDRVAKLVYVDAPRGRSNADAFPGIVEMRQYGQVVDGVELVVFPSEDLIAFYGVTEPGEVAWMMQRLTPMPWKCIEQELQLRDEAAVDSIPHYYVVAKSSLEMGAHHRIAEADRVKGKFWVIEGPHDLMVTEPGAVADLLEEIATAPAPASGAAVAAEREVEVQH